MVTYNSQDDFIEINSRSSSYEVAKRRGGKKYDKEEWERKKEEISKRELDNKFRSIISSLRLKKIKDEDIFYLIIEIDRDSTPSKREDMLNRLSAEIHTYMDDEHNIILLSIPNEAVMPYMERDLPLSIKEPIINIREMNKYDLIDRIILENEEEFREKKEIMIHIIPNIDLEKSRQYMEELIDYIETIDNEVILRYEEKDDMVLIKSDISGMESIISETNYIYKIESVPIPEINENREMEIQSGDVESTNFTEEQLEDLSTICLFDTGCDDIPQLSQLLVNRDKYHIFSNVNDSNVPYGHGTPIACLLTYGENGNIPRVKIISYKIYSKRLNQLTFPALLQGINKYPREISRIYTSSIVYYDNRPVTYAKFNNRIQEKNICFIASVGNSTISSGYIYPDTIFQNEVMYPSKLPNIIGAGAITKKEKSGSIAPMNELSPITRVGANIPDLFNIKKPDFVDHGGNVCYNGDKSGIGVETYCKNGIKRDFFLGTSFAAPLIAGKIAEIENKYGNSIENVETLKALLLMMCENRIKRGYGFGEPKLKLDTDNNHAVFFSEGIIDLSDFTQPNFETRYSSNVIIPVPAGVGRIDMILVHSDYYQSTKPKLNTFLKVKAWKRGRESSPVPPLRNVDYEKTNVKFYSWSYSRRSMQSDWRFEILPETTAHIDYKLRKNIKVRYGCVLILTSKENRLTSLSNDVINEIRRWSSPQPDH